MMRCIETTATGPGTPDTRSLASALVGQTVASVLVTRVGKGRGYTPHPRRSQGVLANPARRSRRLTETENGERAKTARPPKTLEAQRLTSTLVSLIFDSEVRHQMPFFAIFELVSA